jgi:DNA-binding SARP family transcriptional activator
VTEHFIGRWTIDSGAGHPDVLIAQRHLSDALRELGELIETDSLTEAASRIRFRILGPLEIRAGEDWRGIGAPKWRSVLAVLLIKAGQIVPADELINEVWGGEPPAKASNLISIYVLRLRRLIGDTDGSVLVTRAPGYLLRLAPGDTDAQLFETLVREGGRAYTAGDPEQATAQLAEALALWHGSPLADVPQTALVETEVQRLAELRLDAAGLRIKAELACGSHAEVIPELRRLLADHELRENLWLMLMQALDGAGRHAEALDAYGQARTVIADELGVDPGAELRQYYADLLAADITGDHPDSVTSLRDRATSDADADVRRAAVQSLAARWGDDPATAELLRDRATNDPDESVRQAAAGRD